MSIRTRLVATLAAALLVIASVGAVSAKTPPVSKGDATFSVYYSNSADGKDYFTVTKQTSWKGNGTSITCAKSTDPALHDFQCDTISGGSWTYYLRDAIGSPWYGSNSPYVAP